MRTVFTTDSNGRVTVTEDREDVYPGEVTRETVTYECPRDGGYVTYGPDNRQICDSLFTRGATLRCSSRANLIDLIRREYRRGRRLTRAGR